MEKFTLGRQEGDQEEDEEKESETEMDQQTRDNLERARQIVVELRDLRELFMTLKSPLVEKSSIGKGLCGLKNIGNTCYLNSATQCLSNCQALSRYFRKCDAFLPPPKGGRYLGKHLPQYFSLTMKELWDPSNSSFEPRSLVQEIFDINPSFSGYGQQDSQEYLRCLLDFMHELIKEENVESLELTDVQEGDEMIDDVQTGSSSSSSSSSFHSSHPNNPTKIAMKCHICQPH
eukprot:TRINITY_DN985_c0_g2_i2.p1 TRINITY_DN985_c0_g2~~TRINITY_DN985_c0_g2_i2.p1  ORF type:complete len:232 (+),score=77.04 TRINITY_DN985_c0_g2_i2:666-1361(+)